MKSLQILAPLSLIFLAACSSDLVDSEPAEPITLFNGENLDGWSHVLVEDLPIEAVWSIEDGVIVCKGEPLGYLQTVQAYQDFNLTFEWRWAPGGEPGNSGVLLRIASEPETFMPRCVEAQLKHGSAGDIWAFYGAGIDTEVERAREVTGHKDLGDFVGISMIKNAEKAPGEWNHYEIELSGDSLMLKINSELVNEATGLEIVSGPIGFQSEGGEIHFRNIKLRPL